MADFIKLKDSTVLEIEEGASLSNIIYDAKSGEDGLRVAGLFTAENVKHVEFFSSTFKELVEGDAVEPSGVYDDLGITSVYFDVEHMQVLVNLYEKTQLELRVDALEENQEIISGALDDLIMG